MLPLRSRELLTAYVDGELSTKQRRQVERLLRESAEARQLLAQLEDDARRLRGLVPAPLDRDLAAPVITAIRERRLRPTRRQRLYAPTPPSMAWAGMAAAAAVLLILGMSSYFYFHLAATAPPTANAQPKDAKPLDGHASRQRGEEKRDDAPTPAEQRELPQRVAKGPEKPPAPPLPEEGPGPTVSREEAPITAPSMEIFKPERVEVTLPVILALRDLDTEGGRAKLRDELRQDAGFRVEFPCRNASRAFERFQLALKAQHFGLVVEQNAQARLKQPQWKTNYVLFMEDVTPEEVDLLLQEVGRIDRKGKPAEAQLADLVVTRLSKANRKEFFDLLGADPAPVPARSTGPLGTDPRKPLTDVTVDQVGKALTSGAGQGGSRGEPTKPVVKPTERQVLALAYNPVRPRSGSPDVQRFLNERMPARPVTIQVLLVLRGM